MIVRLREFWGGRSPRERVMLAVMGVALGLFAAWLLVLRPLDVCADQAAGRRMAAEADLMRIKRSAAPARPRPDNLEATLRVTAAAQGLDPILAMSEEGGLGFRFNSDQGRPVLLWLTEVKAATGLEPTRVSLLAEDGRLAIDGAY